MRYHLAFSDRSHRFMGSACRSVPSQCDTQVPSEEEWEAIRPTFEMLYLAQSLSLREVMQVLRDCIAVKIT